MNSKATYTELASVEEDRRKATKVNNFCREAIEFAVQNIPYGGLIVAQLRDDARSGVGILWKIILPFLVPMLTAVLTAGFTGYVTLQVLRAELGNLQSRVHAMEQRQEKDVDELKRKDDLHDKLLIDLIKEGKR